MIVGIIPARYASTRFPGKSLIDIKGKSMIQRVYEQSAKSATLHKLVVATDDERILSHVQSFGGEAVMTGTDHPSGTDRCWDALQQLGGHYQYVINIQGDEPFIDPAQIDELAAVLHDGSVELATQMIPVSTHEELFDQGEVKIVLNNKMEALYFSRMVIPFIKGIDEKEWHKHHKFYRHVGMYAYRRDVLEQVTRLPVSPLEHAESLEQLRWVEHGFKIKCVITRFESHCIDAPGDVEKVIKRMKGQIFNG
jgi:3-deoxy-manno-octulosonate cytidylyltransferase (CMP-KDO synthetase)